MGDFRSSPVHPASFKALQSLRLRGFFPFRPEIPRDRTGTRNPRFSAEIRKLVPRWSPEIAIIVFLVGPRDEELDPSQAQVELRLQMMRVSKLIPRFAPKAWGWCEIDTLLGYCKHRDRHPPVSGRRDHRQPTRGPVAALPEIRSRPRSLPVASARRTRCSAFSSGARLVCRVSRPSQPFTGDGEP